MNPNKIYVSEYTGDNPLGGKSHFVIVTAASDSDTAQKYVKEKIGFDAAPIWLMSVTYPTIYASNGSVPENIQAKILSNSSYHSYE